jgi:hypothetical protein
VLGDVKVGQIGNADRFADGSILQSGRQLDGLGDIGLLTGLVPAVQHQDQ